MRDWISRHDWTAGPLGAPDEWPAQLRTLVELVLNSHAQIVLFWGPQYVAIYNDAYAPTIGDKHPAALGCPASEYWAELWDDLEPLLDGVRLTGHTFSAKDRPFYIERHGYGEIAYFDVSYSLVGEVGARDSGVLCIVNETTETVVANRRLRESENRFRALVTATADMIFRMDADLVNLVELDGKDFLPSFKGPDREWLSSFIPADDHHHVDHAIHESRRLGQVLNLEHRLTLHDGATGWFRTRAVPIRNDAGDIVEWFGASTSVTEQRRQREHLELVIHELDHRVKNTLAMVQSIALRTFRDVPGIDAAQRTFLERLQAIAQANALITGEGGHTSLADAVQRALLPHVPDQQRLTLTGPEVQVASKTALAISLAMHELASNAVKYGAWSAGAGGVQVQWFVEDDAPPILVLEWQEQGGPPVVPPTYRGFGSRLIETGLSGEIDGDVELLFEPQGVRCRLRGRASPQPRR